MAALVAGGALKRTPTRGGCAEADPYMSKHTQETSESQGHKFLDEVFFTVVPDSNQAG